MSERLEAACHAHGFASACFNRVLPQFWHRLAATRFYRPHAEAKPWAWHPAPKSILVQSHLEFTSAPQLGCKRVNVILVTRSS